MQQEALPIAEDFGAESTTEDVLAGRDLSAKRVLITGVSAGLGVETARALAARGATVVGTARDLDKARSALAPHRALGIEAVQSDLASLASVRACADTLDARGERFDVLIANAGIMNAPYGKTTDGFEIQFGTNHLGHFVLVNRLVSRVRDGGRIVILSSAAHRAADVDLDRVINGGVANHFIPGFEHAEYSPFIGYGRSKTANILFAVELDRRLRDRGIRATALHPGGVMTELLRHTSRDLLQQMAAQSAVRADGSKGTPTKVKTVPQGAATSVWAAFVAPADAIGGRFCEDCRVAEVENIAYKGVRSYAVDPARGASLWALSEAMVGERF